MILFSLELGNALTFSDIITVNVAGSVVPMADHVKLLGVTLDNHLSMDKHVNEVRALPRSEENIIGLVRIKG